jgi:hypothetical protein
MDAMNVAWIAPSDNGSNMDIDREIRNSDEQSSEPVIKYNPKTAKSRVVPGFNPP